MIGIDSSLGRRGVLRGLLGAPFALAYAKAVPVSAASTEAIAQAGLANQMAAACEAGGYPDFGSEGAELVRLVQSGKSPEFLQAQFEQTAKHAQFLELDVAAMRSWSPSARRRASQRRLVEIARREYVKNTLAEQARTSFFDNLRRKLGMVEATAR